MLVALGGGSEKSSKSGSSDLEAGCCEAGGLDTGLEAGGWAVAKGDGREGEF